MFSRGYRTPWLSAIAVICFFSGCASKTAEDDKGASQKEVTKSTSEKKPADQKTTVAAADAEKTVANDQDQVVAEKKPQEQPVAETPSEEQVTVDEVHNLTQGIPGEGPLTNEQIQAWLDDPQNHEIIDFQLPLGMAMAQAAVKGLQENPLTLAKIELGRQLYFDTRLSSDNTVSCASCHHPDEGFAKHTQFGVGVNGQEGGRNSPVSYNRILSENQFWDGRAGTLEEQAVGPIQNPIEMANTHEQAVGTIAGIKGYQMQFEKIFGEEGVTIDNIGRAIAAFERVIVTGPSPYDYAENYKQFADLDELDLADIKEDPEDFAEYQQAKLGVEAHPMSESAKRGMELFFNEKKTDCKACHASANFTDEQYHNLGVGMDADEPDLGRYVVTKEDKDRGAFKTPTIRNVEFTAPYMHDGSQQTLEEVVEWYAKGGHPNPHLSEKIKKLDLTDQDKKDLVSFMKACSGPFPKVERGRLPAN